MFSLKKICSIPYVVIVIIATNETQLTILQSYVSKVTVGFSCISGLALQILAWWGQVPPP